jgi:uncharacterized membrane protein YgdD (TMEM256/DUF423 family)
MLLALLAGVLLKVYDDFVDDDPILTNPYTVSALRTLQIAATTLLLAGDFWLCLLFVVFNGVCAWSDPSRYSGPHDMSYWAIAPLLLGVSWSHRPSLMSSDLGVLAGAIGVALFEPVAYPEEVSWMKGANRFVAAWGLLTAALLLRRISSSARTTLVLFGGYSLASSVVQLLKLTACVPTHASIPTPA